MKHFLTLLLAFGTVSAVTACKSSDSAEMKTENTTTLAVTGMT